MCYEAERIFSKHFIFTEEHYKVNIYLTMKLKIVYLKRFLEK